MPFNALLRRTMAERSENQGLVLAASSSHGFYSQTSSAPDFFCHLAETTTTFCFPFTRQFFVDHIVFEDQVSTLCYE